MKRKYSDPLVFSSILLDSGAGNIEISPAEGGDNPDPDKPWTSKSRALLNADPQLLKSDAPQVTLTPGEAGGDVITDTPVPEGGFADFILPETPSVLNEITGEDPVSEPADSGT